MNLNEFIILWPISIIRIYICLKNCLYRRGLTLPGFFSRAFLIQVFHLSSRPRDGTPLGRTIHMRACIVFFHGKVHETVARRAVTEASGRTAYARIASRRHRRSGKIKSRPREEVALGASRGINAGFTMRGKPKRRSRSRSSVTCEIIRIESRKFAMRDYYKDNFDCLLS